jgi:branched-chain amino acid transport system permease protein
MEACAMTVETVKPAHAVLPLRLSLFSTLRRAEVWSTFFVVVLALLIVPYVSNNLALKLTLWVSFGLCALSLNFVWGRAGIFSFGQNALFGLGAYAYAVVALNAYPTTEETLTALLASGMVGAIAAGALGYFLFYSRLSDVYLSIVTLAVTLIIYTVLASTAGPEYHIGQAELGGFNGIPSLPGIAFPAWSGIGSGELSIRQLMGFAIVFAGSIYLLVCILARSSFGLKIDGLRSNELRMELLGYDVRRLKIVVFCIGGAVSGFGGGLFAAWGTFVNPSVFSLAQAATVVVWSMVGGRESLLGAFVGVLVVQSVADGADLLVRQQTPLIVGLILVFVVVAMPQGIVPSFKKLFRLPSNTDALDLTSFELVALDDNRRRTGVVSVANITKSFGGVTVLEEISASFGLCPVQAIIGPNGAGKSTFFNILTGQQKPDRGLVAINGTDVSALPPHIRCRLGLGIKMQVPCVFQDLRVGQNLELAAMASRKPTRIEEALSRVGLLEYRNVTAGSLAHGQQQWLEIALVLVQNPSVILLDEPGAGMSDEDKRLTLSLIRRLSDHHTIIVVEHDMAFVKSLEAPVLMLHQGKVFRSGSFDALVNDEQVVDAYLGSRKHG